MVSGEMSSSDYRLRQFSNYSVKHQSWGLMQAVLRPDGQCNHQRGGRELPPLSLSPHPCPAALSIKLPPPHHLLPTFAPLVLIFRFCSGISSDLFFSPLTHLIARSFRKRGKRKNKTRNVRGLLTVAAIGGKTMKHKKTSGRKRMRRDGGGARNPG